MFKFERKDGYVTLVKCYGNYEKIVVPGSIDGMPVTEIEDWAFEHAIASCIVLPDSIEIFGNSAFIACENLVDINMPANLKIVKNNVFLGCKSLTEITFPIGVEKIGACCLDGCLSLTHLFAENENAVLSKTSLSTFYNFKIQEISFHLIKSLDPKHQAIIMSRFIDDWGNVEQIKKDEIWSIIKKGKKVKDYLFLSENCNVISFLLDNKIKPNLESTNKYLDHYIKQKNTVATATFLDYKNKSFTKQEVEKVNERKEMVEIGLEDMNFNEFKKLWSCSKKNGEIRINGYFGNEREVTIPAQIDGLPITSKGKSPNGSYVCQKMKILNIEANLISILDNAFAESWELTKVNIPSTVTSIGKYAFNGCSKLDGIVLPDGLNFIDNYAFHIC